MWNHRIVYMGHSGDPWFAVMEAHYNSDGTVAGFADACLGDEHPEQIVAILQRMIDDIKSRPDILSIKDGVGFNDKDIPF